MRETFPGERRVALVPASVPELVDWGVDVLVEQGAGVEAGFADELFRAKGARLTPSRAEALQSDLLVQVRTLGANRDAGRADLQHLQPRQVLIGLADPLAAHGEMLELAERGVTLFALELIPRTTRAQSMDVLTSMATLSGYKAVLLAAERLSKIFPMMVTAAGTLAPARVLVLGAGVSGLQAIATARRLGALVKAYDVRPEVREEVESVGGEFAELPLETKDAGDERGYARDLGSAFYRKQQELMTRLVAEADVVITTAAVFGKRAPCLVTARMVEAMSPGSVIVDLAADTGGNCELTRPDDVVSHAGVRILGPTNVPSTVPFHASQMYAKNVQRFVVNLLHDGKLDVSLEDEIVRETLVLLKGEIVHPRVRESIGPGG